MRAETDEFIAYVHHSAALAVAVLKNEVRVGDEVKETPSTLLHMLHWDRSAEEVTVSAPVDFKRRYVETKTEYTPPPWYYPSSLSLSRSPSRSKSKKVRERESTFQDCGIVLGPGGCQNLFMCFQVIPYGEKIHPKISGQSRENLFVFFFVCFFAPERDNGA